MIKITSDQDLVNFIHNIINDKELNLDSKYFEFTRY